MVRLGDTPILLGVEIFISGGIYWVALQPHPDGGVLCQSSGGYHQLGGREVKRISNDEEIEIIGSFYHYPPIKPKNMLIYNLMLKMIDEEGLRMTTLGPDRPMWCVTTKIPVFAYIIINRRTHLDLYADHFILRHGRAGNVTKVFYADPDMMVKIRDHDLAAQIEEESVVGAGSS